MKAEEFIKSFLIIDKNDLSNTGVPFYSYPKHQVHEAINMAKNEVKNKALISFCKSICQDKPEWPLEGMEMELQPCPVRLIDCVYHDKKGLVQQCLVTYPANGWVLNKELVTELVRERKNDFKELLSFQIR